MHLGIYLFVCVCVCICEKGARCSLSVSLTPVNEFLAVAVLSHVYWLQVSINDSCHFHLFPPSLCKMLRFPGWRVMVGRGQMWAVTVQIVIVNFPFYSHIKGHLL